MSSEPFIEQIQQSVVEDSDSSAPQSVQAAVRQGLTLAEGNALVLNLLEGNPSQRIDQAHDVGAMHPGPEWQRLYDEVKQDVHALGLEAL